MIKNILGWSVLLTLGALTAACGSSGDGEGAGGAAGSSGGSGGSTAGTGGAGGHGTTVTGKWSDCDGHDVTTGTEVKGSIRDDQTWEGTMIVKGDVTFVDGAKLTIKPGTQVIMDADSSIEFGWNGNTATLLAQGTATAPIKVCGNQKTPGYWQNITVGDKVTTDSVIENVIVSDGGSKDASVVLLAATKVDGLEIKNSANDGAWLRDFKDGSRALSVKDSKKAALVLLAPGAVTRFPLGGTFDNNAENFAKLRFDDIAENTDFHELTIPYVQEKTVQVTRGAVVTFDAGVNYFMSPDTNLEFGWNGNDAEVQVKGTAEKPVTIRGTVEDPGLYGSVMIRSQVRTSSKLENLKILHGGGGTEPALRVEAAITLKDVTLGANKNGAYIGRQGLAAGSSKLSIMNTTEHPLTVQPDALVSLPTGGTFPDNGKNYIQVEVGDYTKKGTIPNLGIPYRINGSLETKGDTEFNIAAGTTFLMSADSGIVIGWNGNTASINAVGTAAAPIVFKGESEAAGSWVGIFLDHNVLTTSKLDYVQILNAGGGSDPKKAALMLQMKPTVTNSKFQKSGGYGILKKADDATNYATSNTFAENTSGAVGNF